MQKATVILVLTGCFEAVPLSEVHLNQCLVRALAQWLSPNGGQAGLDSLAVPADSAESLAHRLEGMESQMVVSFLLSYNPVVLIPIGQQIR